MICPRCGSSKRKEVTQRAETKHMACAQCGHSAFLDQEVHINNPEDLKTLLEQSDYELTVSSETLREATEALAQTAPGKQDFILKSAAVKSAERDEQAARKKIRVLSAVTALVTEDEEGYIVFSLPGLGILYMVVWGGGDPLLILNASLNAGLPTNPAPPPPEKPQRRRGKKA